MLDYLELERVGPAPHLKIDFAPRLNLLTGDNGLGKTFFLDVAWWALTRTWARLPAWPQRGNGAKSTIRYRVEGKTGPSEQRIPYDFKRQEWKVQAGRPPMPGVVIYAQVDGGFSVWDPARNYWRKLKSRTLDDPDRPEAYHFRPKEVWDGLEVADSVVSNGLIRDWVSWQRQDHPSFGQLRRMLRSLSPDKDLSLEPGQPMRVSLEDVRDIPTIEMPYGPVPLIYASAGIRRIAALSYLTVWAWHEHIEASKLLHQEPENRLILLFDEVETHLHPSWQRLLLPALLGVIDELSKRGSAQLIAASHAPMVLASVEPVFDEMKDQVFHLDLQDGNAVVRKIPWAKQGDAVAWLVSEVFGLKQARSREAERAIEAAEAWMRGDTEALPEDLSTEESIHEELKRVLAGHDPFWPRWVVTAKPLLAAK